MALQLLVGRNTPIFNNDGQINAGGNIAFFDLVTDDPAVVYSDVGLTNVANPIQSLDSAGRMAAPLYVDGNNQVTARIYGPPIAAVNDGPLFYTESPVPWFSNNSAGAATVSAMPSQVLTGQNVQDQLDQASDRFDQIGLPGTAGANVFARNTIAQINQFLGIRPYESAPRAIVLPGVNTFAHGLTGIPDIVELRLHCISSDAGYAVGDIIDFEPSADAGRGVTTQVTASEVLVHIGPNGLSSVIEGGGAAGTNLVSTRWRLAVLAFRIPR